MRNKEYLAMRKSVARKWVVIVGCLMTVMLLQAVPALTQQRVVVIPFLQDWCVHPGSVSNGLGMVFNYIPPGTFVMGSPEDEPGRGGNESPQHQVTLTRGFYMQTTEVTQAQWKAVMSGANPSCFTSCGDRCPVERVTWEDVQDFISQLNTMGMGTYRLPTEAEWEYAARSGSTRAFANGEITQTECSPVDPNLTLMGWYCGNAGNTTHPVAQKRPNAWGLYDMHGNVWELVQDWLVGTTPYYPSDPVTDPTGPASGEYRGKRGGSWYPEAKLCRSAERNGCEPDVCWSDLGFRLVKEP